MIKNYSDSLFEEIKLLAKFPDDSQLEGLKIHQSADPAYITSAQSLFSKGLITQTDGGYLTNSGIEVVQHLHQALNILSKV